MTHNPSGLTRQYDRCRDRDTKPLLQYSCNDCARWLIRVYPADDLLVVVHEAEGVFDHEMTAGTSRDGERINEFLAAMDTVDQEPRRAAEPFLTTVSSLAGQSGRDQDLRAFCCAEHWIAVDDLLGALMKRVESRVSYPDRQ